ncbi:hypothetical protein Tco_0695991 [Tanacetum coccineum]
MKCRQHDLFKPVHFLCVSCELYHGPYLSKDFSNKEQVKEAKKENKMEYQEKTLSLWETLNKFMAKSAKRDNKNTDLIKRAQASAQTAIRINEASLKKMEIQTDLTVKNKSVDQDDDVLTSLNRLKVNVPHVDALKGTSRYSTHLADLLKKSRIDDENKAKMIEWCFAWLKNTLPTKENDPGSFTLPCLIDSF